MDEHAKIRARLLDTLTDPTGAGSDLDVGEVDGEWVEIRGGNLDIDHLASEVQALVSELRASAAETVRLDGTVVRVDHVPGDDE